MVKAWNLIGSQLLIGHHGLDISVNQFKKRKIIFRWCVFESASH